MKDVILAAVLVITILFSTVLAYNTPKKKRKKRPRVKDSSQIEHDSLVQSIIKESSRNHQRAFKLGQNQC